MKTFSKILLISACALLVVGCVEDELYYDHGYYSSGSSGHYSPPRYYPDDVTSGYNRHYHKRNKGYESSQSNTGNGYSSSQSNTGNGYSSSQSNTGNGYSSSQSNNYKHHSQSQTSSTTSSNSQFQAAQSAASSLANNDESQIVNQGNGGYSSSG